MTNPANTPGSFSFSASYDADGFALSHGGYGLPTLTAAVFAVSLAIGWALRKRGNLVPCIVAHGIFDAVQLLVVMPIAVEHLRELA